MGERGAPTVTGPPPFEAYWRLDRPGAAWAAPCFVTAGEPGIGGRIKERPEDFLVEEIPLYEPCGTGEHLYLFVQKRNLSTLEMVCIVAEHFGVHRSAVGYAGLKDKHAITRQVVSVHLPGKSDSEFRHLDHERMAVLWADRHTNKLRPGHLRGNRFSIRVRSVEPTAALAASRMIGLLARVGVPNRVGEQRFGLLENNHIIGRAMILGRLREAADLLLGPSASHPESQPEARAFYAEGKYAEAAAHFAPALRTERGLAKALAKGLEVEKAVRRIDRTVASYFVSAFQSAVFNAVLDRRIHEGQLGTLHIGDVAFRHVGRATFDVTAETLDKAETHDRVTSFEISPSGPMWGAAMRQASGVPGRVEREALEASGVTEERVAEFDRTTGGMMQGARRPLRVPLIDPDVEGGVDEHGPFVRCAFELPRGSFATVVMRELMKTRVGGEEEAEA
ncbi:MAG TPA: tRNA pseudouridine(13) synthase TruD [Phycisphaerales bacterium]|nr:tRNA pseudouridine(13) synthase TruD [Phycisphaerales bacterium]